MSYHQQQRRSQANSFPKNIPNNNRNNFQAAPIKRSPQLLIPENELHFTHAQEEVQIIILNFHYLHYCNRSESCHHLTFGKLLIMLLSYFWYLLILNII